MNHMSFAAHCLVMKRLQFQVIEFVVVGFQILVDCVRTSPAMQLQEPIVQAQSLAENFQRQQEASGFR